MVACGTLLCVLTSRVRVHSVCFPSIACTESLTPRLCLFESHVQLVEAARHGEAADVDRLLKDGAAKDAKDAMVRPFPRLSSPL
jgi:hypothetical protein